ncbi:hypothetical protein CR513_52150, partial [Mucuna pruriens]
MEEEAKPIRQQQRRMNLTILDVVKKEVTKLLAVGIIYAIFDSQWVRPVQVVPKKSGMTIMKNQHDELATRKDHFPLPFIDQLLEKLAWKSHFCFLDGFYGYMQIHITPEDQHKTTFTCPFGTFVYTHMPFGLCNAPSSKIIVFSDHAALRFLVKKPDAKSRLIWWMLLLQEFNIETRDKKGVENSVAYHLSMIERENDLMPIRDEFLDEQLLHITTPTPWFANICNFVATSQFPLKASRLYKERLQNDAKYYI